MVLLGVLKGAMMVMADLARLLKHDGVEIDWITVSSYGNNTSSSGVIRVLKEPDLDLAGVASVEVFSLLRKCDLVKVEVPLRYLGCVQTQGVDPVRRADLHARKLLGLGQDKLARYAVVCNCGLLLRGGAEGHVSDAR